MSARRAIAATGLAVLVACGLAVLPLASAGAGVPPPTTTTSPAASDQCVRFGELRAAFDAINQQQSITKTFTAISQAARRFRRVARQAPDEIAADMTLLARSMTALQHTLDSFRDELHKTRKAKAYENMIDPVQQAFEEWAKAQDTEALGAAQADVQAWLTATCGFDLGSPGGSTTTASCTSVEEAAQTVLDAWQAGDRATASSCASDAAVEELFGVPTSVEMTYAGCTGVDSTHVDCSYRYEGGSMTMTITGSGTSWRVETVTGHAD